MSRHLPCTVIATQRVQFGKTADFLAAQEKISAAMREYPGFLGKELIRPAPGLQEEWVSVFRFASTDALQGWMQSPERAEMTAPLEACADGPGGWQVVAGEDAETPPVTVVFSHQVKPGLEEDFRAWRRQMLTEMGRWPGYLGANTFDPQPGVQEDHVLIARFASAAGFETWMGSAKRAALLARLEPLVVGYKAQVLGSGLGGWFAFDDAPPAVPELPRWKQILMVTLGLYPTVMLLALLVDPWLAKWVSFPAQMIVGNLICVSLLTWPIMPWLNRRFAGWLVVRSHRSVGRDVLGAAVVAVVLGLWVALFLVAWPRLGGGGLWEM